VRIRGKECKVETRLHVDVKSGTELKYRVWEVAGEVWDTLNVRGPQTLDQLSLRVDGTRDLVSFALGWLIRGGAVEVLQGKADYWVKLSGFDSHQDPDSEAA
jgi:hypothetical protein